MPRRLAAAIVAAGAVVHVLLIAFAPVYGHDLLGGPPLLLAAAFLFALAALFAALWVLLTADAERRILDAFALHCTACGQPADAQCDFCTRCGATGNV